MSNANVASQQNFRKKLIHDRLKFYITSNAQSHGTFANAVKTGLSSKQKFLLPQYFYDEKGSKLFELISDQPEYYLTRTEASILESYSDEIAKMCNQGIIVELGSGNSKKTRIIIDRLIARHESLQYFPIDISNEVLKESSEALLSEYPNLSVTAIVAEYFKGLTLIKKDISLRKLVLFLGSSLGNFDVLGAKKFIQTIKNHIRDQDMLLIGLDMHKDTRILNAAYNDLCGVTAQFNLNILARINRELHGDFSLNNFEHLAFYNESKRRVEMHLVSKVRQEVNIADIGEVISFKEGESIHTESSHKFTIEQIESMIEENFQMVRTWTDEKKLYNVILLAPLK
ncbi:MAG: L-histidine N(alpha)-methyltransferase [Nitrososphaerales archaeon]